MIRPYQCHYLQEQGAEAQRYECLNEDPRNYGVFTLPEVATFLHHERSWMAGLISSLGLDLIEEKEVAVQTMNGHRAQAFQMLCRKPQP